MLESEKNSSNSTSVDDTSHTFVPTPNVDYTVKQAYLSWVEAARIREKYGCEPPLGVVKTTKPVTIYAGERKEIHGITKIKHGGYSVNCISEPAMEKALPKGLKLITGYSPFGAGSLMS